MSSQKDKQLGGQPISIMYDPPKKKSESYAMKPISQSGGQGGGQSGGNCKYSVFHYTCSHDPP